MGKRIKYSTGLWCLAGCADRFVPTGYINEEYDLRTLIDMAASLDDIDGIEMVSNQLDGVNIKDVKEWVLGHNLQVSSILANTFGDNKFKLGALTHTDKNLRSEAIDICKQTVEAAEKIDCPMVTLWLGSDGFDYPFQVDYVRQLETLISSLKEISDFNPAMKIALEYKLKEPRMHLAVSNVGKALHLALECGNNVGVTLDFGHALMSKENPGESVALLSSQQKLFNIHINDAHGEWDDDLIVGAVHSYETLEFLYYLDVIGYDGWLGLDIFPYRMDAMIAAKLCVDNLNRFCSLLEKLDYDELAKAQATLDAGKSQKMLGELFFNS